MFLACHPCTGTFTGGFGKSFHQADLIKAERRIAIKDYRPNNGLK
jgi:hypothetical protein